MERHVPVVDKHGNQVGTVDVPDAWIEPKRGAQAVHETVVAELAQRRAGTASTKTRAEVRGGGAKPYRQKGTGRARAGTNRSPLWGGGGVVFGPKPRSYAKKINRKVRNLAARRVLHDRLQENEVIVLDALDLMTAKTREMARLLDAVGAGQNALVVDTAAEEATARAIRNLPNACAVAVEEVDVYSLMRYRKVVFTKDALTAFGTVIAAAQKNEVDDHE